MQVAVPVALQGPVEELADAYAAEREWLSFQVDAYASAKKENAAIAPVAPGLAESPEEADADEAGASRMDDLDSPEPVPVAQADIVFHSSPTAMDDAEEAGAVDPQTRADMLEDALCIVAADSSNISAVSTADIEAGSYPLAAVSGKGAFAKRQRQVLEALGVMEDGRYVGRYAAERDGSNDAVRQVDSTAELFGAVAADDSRVAIVCMGDLCRYGGVKVVGAVPARLYTPLRYPHALGANLSALENGEQVEAAARDFLNWMLSDAKALDIIEKWGFHLAA